MDNKLDKSRFNSSKLKKKQTDLIRKIVIPKSGSYDLNQGTDDSFDTNSNRNNSDILRDEVELSAAKQHQQNADLTSSTDSAPKLLPLYVLLSGYLLITLMSFLLIVAIQREQLNLILFWIISLSVFILPEIGLNIVLAHNSFDWFRTTTGFYTLVALVVRVTIDLPCIGIILAYHINRTRRNEFLKKMLKPIKRDILNGEVLKSYNNLDIDTRVNNVQYPAIDTMPLPSLFDYSGQHTQSSLPLGFADLKENLNDQSTSTDEQSEPIQQQQQQNAFYYKFLPNSNYEIHVRPSKSGEFVQRFVNVDEIMFNKKSAYPTHSLNNLVMVQTEQVDNSKYQHQQVNLIEEDTELKHLRPKSKKSTLYYDSDVSIPIQVEKTRYRPSLRQTKQLSEQDENKMINISKHQIYLPPVSSFGLKSHQIKFSDSDKVILNETSSNGFDMQTATYLKGSACNCINIASCSKENLNEFIHSQDCVLARSSNNHNHYANNSNSSINVSNPDLFVQRKHF